MKIPINRLKTCPINSEIYRDSEVGDLVNSIGEVGLLQPLAVTPDNTIISGHRRFKAIQSLRWTEVEVEVKEVDDDSIPLYVVLFNQSRNKVASELIREIMVLMDSQWIGQGNWNRSKKDQMITFGDPMHLYLIISECWRRCIGIEPELQTHHLVSTPLKPCNWKGF
jgi:hypothetical protein